MHNLGRGGLGLLSNWVSNLLGVTDGGDGVPVDWESVCDVLWKKLGGLEERPFTDEFVMELIDIITHDFNVAVNTEVKTWDVLHGEEDEGRADE